MWTELCSPTGPAGFLRTQGLVFARCVPVEPVFLSTGRHILELAEPPGGGDGV